MNLSAHNSTRLVSPFRLALPVHGGHLARDVLQVQRDDSVSEQREVRPPQILHQRPAPRHQSLRCDDRDMQRHCDRGDKDILPGSPASCSYLSCVRRHVGIDY